jgi:hypothetical protein
VGFLEDLAAEKTAQRPTADVEVLLNGNLYTLRFTKLDGTEWAAEVDKYPARPGILIDSRYGYDLRKLVKGIAHKCGVLLDGETEVPLRWDPPGRRTVSMSGRTCSRRSMVTRCSASRTRSGV